MAEGCGEPVTDTITSIATVIQSAHTNQDNENKSDMDGDILCNSHSITLLSCNNSRSPGQKDEDGLRLTSKKRACSPRWSEEPALHHLQHHQHHACPPTERSLPLGYSNSHIPLHNNNNTSTLSITTTTSTTSTVNTNHTPWQRRVARHKVRGKKSTLRLEDKNSQNRKVTDYFPIRRSSRKSKAELKVQQITEKGRGVFATRDFQKGEYVVEYHGDLLLIPDAKRREAEYAQNPATGCYIVDATKETGRMGRLLNHMREGCMAGNLPDPKLHDINSVPAPNPGWRRGDLDAGEELLSYDLRRPPATEVHRRHIVN
ncbi:hypothetical protein CRUP_003762 [Coryphaenoides rupestris]|nr:hypothetical protein CRUP_003762 [Coryphaenoides rupestris]